MRLASIQHGDYLRVRRQLDSGGAETYGSQRYSVNVFNELLIDTPHLVVSLNGPESAELDGNGQYVTLGPRGASWLPGRVNERLRARRVLRLLDEFKPTHLLLRAGDIVGCRVLQWANRRGVPTAVIIASRFDPQHPPAMKFCKLANDSNVLFVGNHNRVATRSLLACGLRPEKAIAWDYPPQARPDQFSPKVGAQKPLNVLFAGSTVTNKGVTDVVAAVTLARARGLDVTLSVCGDGDLRAGLQAHPGVAEGWLEVPGSISSQEVLERMRASWVVVVPTRHAFPEALPLVIIEALATRTPVILSDHPIFKEYFAEDRGVRMFPAGNPEALAAVLTRLAADQAGYERLSHETGAVWQSLQIETRLHELFNRFAGLCGLPAPTLAPR